MVREPDWDRRSDWERRSDLERRPGEGPAAPRDDRRLERLVSAGRQLVDGVAGTRPGSRPAGRPAGRPGARPRLDSLGRWVEDKLDWLLEDGDDWREPWQEEGRLEPARRPQARGRQPLEAISRRGSRPAPAPAPAPQEDWPDDAAFTVPRWQRGATPPQAGAAAPPMPPAAPEGAPGRPLPRSSRRRG